MNANIKSLGCSKQDKKLLLKLAAIFVNACDDLINFRSVEYWGEGVTGALAPPPGSVVPALEGITFLTAFPRRVCIHHVNYRYAAYRNILNVSKKYIKTSVRHC